MSEYTQAMSDMLKTLDADPASGTAAGTPPPAGAVPDTRSKKAPSLAFSIKYKLALLISFLIIAVIITLSVVFINNQKQFMIRSMEDKGRIMASQIAKSMLEVMLQPEFYIGGQREEIVVMNVKQPFDDSAKERSIIYVKLFDKNDTLVYAAGAKSQAKLPAPPFSMALKDANGRINHQFKRIGTGSSSDSSPLRDIIAKALQLENAMFDISYPVMPATGQKTIGMVRVGLSQENDNLEIIEMVQRALIVSVIVLAAGFLLAFMSALIFTNPITRVKNALVAVSEGDLQQYLPARSNDEIGILTWNFNIMTEGLREKEKMRDRFGKAVSEEIVEVMMSGELKLGGENKNVTMLFSDIRSFTKMSSSLRPEEVLEMLNDYFTLMEGIIKRNMGVIDKYVGDEIMAIFGAVNDHQDSEECACRTAVEMIITLEALNKQRVEEGKLPIRIGIGINSGVITAGMLGSKNRMNYTVIGDTVNMASRLCDAAGNHGLGPIVIAEDTYQKVKDISMVRAGPLIAAKGKDHPVPIYELLGVLDRKKTNKLKLEALGGAVEQSQDLRRTFERKSIEAAFKGEWRRLNDNNNVPIIMLKNASYGGMRFVTKKEVAPGESIDVKIVLPQHTMRIITEVRQCVKGDDGNYEVGVEFVTISGMDLGVLIKLMEKKEA